MLHVHKVSPRAPSTDSPVNPWLLLVLQLPARPSNARVKTWRRLQQLGAVAVKNAVYVLPNSAQAIEDFEWMRTEIRAARGEANVFSAANVDGVDDRDIEEQFRRARSTDYQQLLKDVRALHRKRGVQAPRDEERIRATRQLRERLTRLRAVDFFGGDGGDDVERELTLIEHAVRRGSRAPLPVSSAVIRSGDFKGRVWVTRRRPGVDRFASAWLISRFIDPEATFVFADSPEQAPDAVSFDMFGGTFGHEGDACTFEVLARRFAIFDPIVRRVGEIVHDLDLKEDRFRAPHSPGIGVIVEGLRSQFADDGELMKEGVVVFEALYRGLTPTKPGRRRASSTVRMKHGRNT